MSYVTLPSSNQNIKLYYEVHGSGDIKVLFIMGLRTEGRAWKYQTDFFLEKSNYQCVSYDNRGCGRSSIPSTLEYTTVQMAKDALELIDHLCWPQCHVVGVSMGGMIALELALLAHRRILSLTLMATHAGGLIGQAPFLGIRGIFRSLILRDEEQLVNNALSILYGPKTLSDPDKRQYFFNYHRERYRTRVPLKLAGMFGQMFAVQRHYISYADLLKIRYSNFPCLIMVGTEDRLVRKTNSYMLQKTLGCRLIRLEHAGHDLGGEFAEQVNQELLTFFESVDSKNQSSDIPVEYTTEIQALELCCQHRTHCFIYNLIGFFKGSLLGSILYYALTSGLIRNDLMSIHLCARCMVLIGCIRGLRRSIGCIYNAIRARKFVKKQKLFLAQTTNDDGIGFSLTNRQKNGIPHGCGFEFPILPLIFTVCLSSLAYWTRQHN
ncbi:unnamed protein product [Adineta steineri]|uniref:AB hydrolase-1 domain-containing protein n=1 Tax=Adineta steineri TaxID=433720 RepID=A0A819B0B9_9BILA|nr:unnamed protein product [Adineta steineri]CAF1238162.1 unnamed protein product [Adineta steineri]CAF1260354.1 unnamed protein product [Adineta steineri]CAF3790422.1 unnamed protein product [Adineta steineri]CAF3833540.1 unnamed protein product [Adineta steineri]